MESIKSDNNFMTDLLNRLLIYVNRDIIIAKVTIPKATSEAIFNVK